VAPQIHNACSQNSPGNSPTNDVDWVKFEAEADTYYTFYTDQVGPEGDTVLELYDGAGNRLDGNDDHTQGTASQFDYRINEAGTYYIKSQIYNPTYHGSGTEYALKIRRGQAPVATPTPTPAPPTSAEATPTPSPSEIETLIGRNYLPQSSPSGE